MLFWKIGGSSNGTGIEFSYILATMSAFLLIFLVSLICIKAGLVSSFQAGSFSQSCYRFNTYIGVAVILNSLGAQGIAYFGVLIAIIIPLVNVCAVSTLIWHSQDKLRSEKKSRLVIRSLLSNPLIIGCVLGLLYAHFFRSFPVFVNNSLQMMSMVTLPLALISIGGSFSFKGISKNLNLSVLAAFLKLAVLPVTGYMLYRIFGVSGLGFKVGMIFLCLPVSTAIYVLSSQLNSDTELASSAIVVSTMFSFASLSVALLL